MRVMDLSLLNDHLAHYPYLDGFLPSTADVPVAAVVEAKESQFPHIERWKRHVSSFTAEHSNKFPSPSTYFARSLLEGVPACNPSKMTVLPAAGDSSAVENLPQYLLDRLAATEGSLNSIDLSEVLNVDHQKIVGAVKSLLSHEGMLIATDVAHKRTLLTDEGEEMATKGSHEYNVFKTVGKEGALQADIMKLPIGKVGVAKAIQAGWVAVDKSGGAVKVVRKADEDAVVDQVREQLEKVKLGEEVETKVKTELKKRKLINEITVKGVVIARGPNFSTTITKPEVDLTPEMIQSGSWKSKAFKQYNFDALGVQPSCGHLHPLMKVRAEFRQIFFQMGFTEMATNKYVESSFWNFDALFQPQQHPARDAHDTFFVSDPALSTKFPEDYLERVKTVHSKGGFGSVGYNYDWKLEEAQKNVLRTHTTAVSARQLYQLAQDGFKDSKMFSIDRVFRNETLDATHLAEFHQVEGVIAEKNLSLAHLIGIFTEFFKKLGIEDLRFKPTYNPYTEPSMEIFAFHQGLNKWVEIGNSGMFRPEMLLPMGLPADVNVAGYGLSLERPTMIRFGIDNIRDLFGPKVDLQMIYDAPICRLDKKD